jgi:hypothetical protein
MRGRCLVWSRVLSAVTVIVAVLSAWQLEAAVEVFTVRESPALVNQADREVQIEQFDPSLGSLQSVTIDLQGTGSFLQRFAHFGSGRGELIVKQNLSLVLETLDGNSLISINQAEDHFYPFSGSGGSSGFAGHFEAPHIYGVTASGATALTSESELTQFTGLGFADLLLDARGGLRDHFLRGGGILEGLVLAGANIRVTYNYTPLSSISGSTVPIPEAGTWLAGGFAMLVLALLKVSR